MKLIASLTSPYARKVRIVLSEKRIEYTLEEASPWTDDTSVPDYNPLGKIPVLLMDDGSSLFDSRVIVEYLDTLTPVSRLMPQPMRQRIEIKRWEVLADGICDAAATAFLENKRPKEQCSNEWIERQIGKIKRALLVLSQDLADKTWCSGDKYSLADVAVGCALGYLDLRFEKLAWRESYPNLARHYEKLSQRQSFKDTVPPS